MPVAPCFFCLALPSCELRLAPNRGIRPPPESPILPSQERSITMKRAATIDIPQTLKEVCDPGRLALVVYDMQIGILKQLKNPEEIVGRVSRVLGAARSAGVRVFFMRHMSLPKELMGAFQYRMAMAWQRLEDPEAVTPWFLRDSPGFGITPELKPAASEAIFDKITMSAFEGTPLTIALRDAASRRSHWSASRWKSASSRRRGTPPTSASFP